MGTPPVNGKTVAAVVAAAASELAEGSQGESSNANGDASIDAGAELRRLIELYPSKMKSSDDVQKATRKFQKLFDNLQLVTCSQEFQKEVADNIARTRTDFILAESPWTVLATLFRYLRSNAGGDAERERQERKKEDKVKKLEDRAAEYIKLIDEYDQKDADWESDNEQNSSYLIRDRLERRLMKTHKALCTFTSSSTFTGRPTQKRLKITGIISFVEIEKAVETFVNSQGYLFVPDFRDVLKIAEDVSKGKLFLDEDELGRNAKMIFEHIVKEVKRRRIKDSLDALPVSTADESDDDDPAKHDPELRRKLEENVGKRRKEADVLKEFAQRQDELKEAAKEIGDDIDASTDETETEQEDEEEEENDVLPEEIQLSSDSDIEIVEGENEDVQEPLQSSDDDSDIEIIENENQDPLGETKSDESDVQIIESDDEPLKTANGAVGSVVAKINGSAGHVSSSSSAGSRSNRKRVAVADSNSSTPRSKTSRLN